MRLAARHTSGMRASLLLDLFRLSVTKPNDWVHWETIRDTTFGAVKRQKTANSTNVSKLGWELKGFLGNYKSESWKISLDTRLEEPPGKSRLWKLVVESRIALGDIQISSTLPVSKTPEEPFLPEFTWQTKDYERRMPVWLPFDPKFALNFFVHICSEWTVPAAFIDYESFKAKKWKKKSIAHPSETLIDSAICSIKSFRELARHNSILPVEIDVLLARHSDYRATNEQVVELLAEGDNKKIEEFKSKLGFSNVKKLSLPNAANPISVIVNLFTEDNKVIFIQNGKNGRWDSPAGDFLDPLQDIQRVNPFGLSPQETVIRSVYEDLGVSVHRQSTRWNALAIHREIGAGALLGEMDVGLQSKEVESLFNSRRLNNPSPLVFIDLTPEAILNFFGSCEAWPLNFLEISIALSLRQRFADVTIST